MKEKIVAQSKKANIALIRNVIWIAGAILSVIMFIAETNSWKTYCARVFRGSRDEIQAMGLIEFMFSEHANSNTIWYFVIPLAISILVGYLFYFATSKIELTITDKRVYGSAFWGKRIDLPLDSISSVGSSIFNGIAIATSSGRIVFYGVKNRDELHKALSDLLISRQGKPSVPVQTTIKQEIPQSNADELKKYKELLEMGVITQEEFNAKKKQLLGL